MKVGLTSMSLFGNETLHFSQSREAHFFPEIECMLEVYDVMICICTRIEDLKWVCFISEMLN